jgi:hypothetical protein
MPLNAERQSRTYFADVLSLSDYAPAFDLIKKSGYTIYVSPQLGAFDKPFSSETPGMFTWYSLGVAGMTYNTDVVSAAEAPKSWKDLLDPKWREAVNFKDSASGLQGVQWFILRQLYGDTFWKELTAQKPRTLPSTVQQYERVINREDKIIGLGQYSTYLEFKAKGAPSPSWRQRKGGIDTGDCRDSRQSAASQRCPAFHRLVPLALRAGGPYSALLYLLPTPRCGATARRSPCERHENTPA